MKTEFRYDPSSDDNYKSWTNHTDLCARLYAEDNGFAQDGWNYKKGNGYFHITIMHYVNLQEGDDVNLFKFGWKVRFKMYCFAEDMMIYHLWQGD